MTASDVRSPSRPRSSASARGDDVAHDVHRRIEVVGSRGSARATSAGSGWKRQRAARLEEPAEERRATRSGKSSRVCVPRDSSRASAAVGERPADREQVAQLVAGGIVGGHVGGQRRRATACRLGASRSTPAPVVMSRCSSSSVDRIRSTRRRRHGRRRAVAARPARSTPVALGAVLARDDRVDRAGREHQAVEQRVRREPVRAVHAGARGLAAGPEPGQRGRAVEIGARHRRTGSARRARPGSQSRAGSRPTACAEPPDRREAGPGSRGSPSRRATGGRAPVDEPAGDRARDDVARREVAERVLVGHERDARARRAGPRPRPGAPRRGAAGASTGDAARSGGTA